MKNKLEINIPYILTRNHFCIEDHIVQNSTIMSAAGYIHLLNNMLIFNESSSAEINFTNIFWLMPLPIGIENLLVTIQLNMTDHITEFTIKKTMEFIVEDGQ